jgi:hypothetical protein
MAASGHDGLPEQTKDPPVLTTLQSSTSPDLDGNISTATSFSIILFLGLFRKKTF